MVNMGNILGHPLQDWEPLPPTEGPPFPKWMAPNLPLKGDWPWYKAAAPSPAKALLTITSTPAGAAVSLNGAASGTTPITSLPLDPGTYIILAQKTGYADQTKTVTLVAGQDATEDFQMVAQAAAGTFTLNVVNLPAGAVGWTCSFKDPATGLYSTPSNVAINNPLLTADQGAIMTVPVVTGQLTVMAVGNTPGVFMDIKQTSQLSITINDAGVYTFDFTTQQIS
jgi:hypothetical protein